MITETIPSDFILKEGGRGLRYLFAQPVDIAPSPSSVPGYFSVEKSPGGDVENRATAPTKE